MARPDDDRPFPARWHHLVRILLIDPSVKHIAHAAVDYADFTDGSGCHPSNERLARETGYDKKTVGAAWSVLVALGMAEQVTWHISFKRQADEYDLRIPHDWESMAILGPNGRKFRCQFCGKLFNPKGNSRLRPDGSIGFLLHRMTFCPSTKSTCLRLWNRDQSFKGSRMWDQLPNEDAWKLFRLARDDDW